MNYCNQRGMPCDLANNRGYCSVSACTNPAIWNNYSQKDEIINFLLDMLEEEHIGMRAIAVKEIKDKFGIDL